MKLELMPHQKKAVAELSNGKILRGGVGTGKSLVALTYYTQKEQCGDIYVITTAKKRDELDWLKEAAQLGIGTEVSLYGTITIDSWNNISKYEHLEGQTVIFDEQRLVGSGAWVKSFLKIAKKNHWILLTATPGDTWMDFVPVFIANGFYKNRTDFIRQHVVFKPFRKYPVIDRYIGIAKLKALRDEILVEMPYEKHTIRIEEQVEVTYDKALFDRVWKDRWHVYEDRPIKDVAELFAVARKVVNSDPSRLEAIKDLLKEHPKLIVFYNFNYELKILRELGEICEVGEWNGHKKTAIPCGESWVYLVQYTAGAEGWNCIETDSMVFYSLNYSYRVSEQAKGRIDRLNTLYMFLTYFSLFSSSVVDRAVLRAQKEKKNFNENRYLVEENLQF